MEGDNYGLFGEIGESCHSQIEARELFLLSIQKLTARELWLLLDYWVGGYTFQELGELYDLTSERCRKILVNSEGKIRDAIYFEQFGHIKFQHKSVYDPDKFGLHWPWSIF